MSMAAPPRQSYGPTAVLQLVALTASGKRIYLSLLLSYYKVMFAWIWFFSPSIKLDLQYAPLRKYSEKMSKQEKEP